MKDVEFKILTNEALTADIFKMTLDGDTSDVTRPGQFVDIKIPGRFLLYRYATGRRTDLPLSIKLWVREPKT